MSPEIIENVIRPSVPATQTQSVLPRPVSVAIGLLAGISILYLGREIIIPLALASMLALILTPAASLLERLVGRAGSAILLLTFTMGLIAGASYFISIQLSEVVHEVSLYSDELADKITGAEQEFRSLVPTSVRDLANALEGSVNQSNGANQLATEVRQVPADKAYRKT